MDRPWRTALRAERARPAAVLGPVLRRALARLAATLALVDIPSQARVAVDRAEIAQDPVVGFLDFKNRLLRALCQFITLVLQLAEGGGAVPLGALEHPIEALEEIDVNGQRMRHRRIHCQAAPASTDLRFSAAVAEPKA